MVFLGVLRAEGGGAGWGTGGPRRGPGLAHHLCGWRPSLRQPGRPWIRSVYPLQDAYNRTSAHYTRTRHTRFSMPGQIWQTMPAFEGCSTWHECMLTTDLAGPRRGRTPSLTYAHGRTWLLNMLMRKSRLTHTMTPTHRCSPTQRLLTR